MSLPRRFIPHATFALLLAASFAWSTALAYAAPLPDGQDDFNSPGFIVRHVWVKFGYLASRPFRGDLSREQEDAKVARFFELNARIGEVERVAGDDGTPPDQAAAAGDEARTLRDERAGLENTVEAILEGRLTHVVKEAGLTRHIGGDVVWPPVSIEFQDPPSVLVTSPRSEIRKDGETLLQNDLPIERVREIEQRAERDGRTSALVVEIGGIAMYPAIIPPDGDYRFVLEDIAHEWTHHYLFFTPLGRDYFASAKLTTLNETVADIVGRELGDRLYAEYPLPRAGAGSTASSPRPEPQPPARFDFTAEMRGLRQQVEALLRRGKVDDAERLMEEKRQFLAGHGYYIRKLNQAYFAFHGSYADSAGSIDPIGPKLDALRKQSGSLKAFVAAARRFTSEADLDQALGVR